MKTHDIKRIFKIAQKFEKVCIEYQTETVESWIACGKLTSFNIERPAFSETSGNLYRLADIKLVFDETRVYWAFGLMRFADKSTSENFLGLVGVGAEGNYVYLRIIPKQ